MVAATRGRGIRFAYLIEPPFCFRTPEGDVTGCDVEVARHIASRIGAGRIMPVQTEFQDLLPGLADGRWEMTTGLFVTDERRRLALFSRPIWALPDGLLIRAATFDRISGYRAIAADSSLTLAVVAGQVQADTAKSLGIPDGRIRIFNDYADAATMVETGEVDALASVARAHRGYLEQNPMPDLTMVTVPEFEKPAEFGALAVAKEDHTLLQSIDAELQAFLGTPGHRALMAQFGFSDPEIDLIA